MDTKKYQALLTSADLGSFTRAAQSLGCTQSGLTHMMNALEQEVGFPLLQRGHSGTSLTEQGKRLEPAVRRFLEAGQALETEIDSVRCREQFSIRAGAYSSMAVHWLPAILQSFRTIDPDVRVDVQMGGIEELYGWVRSGEVDMAFVSRQDDLQAEFIPLKEDILVAILSPDDPGGDGETFPVSAFEGREFLMPSLGFDQDILSVFEAHNVHPDIRNNTSVEDAAIVSMVEHGLGVSILSELVLEGLRMNVQALPLDPAACRPIGIAVASLEDATPIVRQFIAYSKRIVGELHQPQC